MKTFPKKLDQLIEEVFQKKGKITFLTGAGISAESGIPTFRGKEGYWKVGSKNYQPQEIGTYSMFLSAPSEVWKWFLFRQTVCRKAVANSGHLALVDFENLLTDRFQLITQNVDGLHLRAGNSVERTFLIHGSLEFVRCHQACTDELYAFPKGIADKSREDDITEEEWELLTCPNCRDLLRPHVLWFDEYYNEEYYKYESALKVGANTDLLFVIGTSGATNLPNSIVIEVLKAGGAIVEINIADNRFSSAITSYEKGLVLRGKSGALLPEIYKRFKEHS